MGDISRSGRGPKVAQQEIRSSTGLGIHLRLERDRQEPYREEKSSLRADFPTGFISKPRNWTFQTKPLFKKIKGPLVDVFQEAEEVLIVIDLGGFRRGDVSLKMDSEKYSIVAKRGDQEFREEIEMPSGVDIENCAEYFRNGVLEIVLPRKAWSDK
jgi:HSP20 family molecular chaperone IbpA